MAYRLREGEKLEDGLRRCAAEELERAIELLAEPAQGSSTVAVHEARKSLKKERALLRLTRARIGAKTYRRENRCFRDAGRRLSAVRDVDVAVQTLDRLAERFAGQVPSATFDAVRVRIEQQRREARAGDGAAGEEVIGALRDARDRLSDWPLEGSAWPVLERGLAVAYRRGAGALRGALKGGAAEDLHEWRKRVKDLWYHLRILEPLWPALVGEQAEQAHVLSEILGFDHDLHVLREVLTADPELDADVPADLDPLVELIDGWRQELHGNAAWLGQRLYAERPKAFLRRLKVYWLAWEAPGVQPVAAP